MTEESSIKRSRDNFEFLLAVCLVAQPSRAVSLSKLIKVRAKEWEKAGIVPPIPVSSCFKKEHVSAFIEKYSEGE